MVKLFVVLSLFILGSSAFAKIKVIRHKGEIYINEKPYAEGVEINVGDTIKADGEKSFIQIKTDYGSNISVRNSSIEIEKINKKSTVMNLLYGKFYHYLKKGTKRDFTLKTKNAVLGVRGTKYFVEAKDDDTYLCVCEGRVDAKAYKEFISLIKNEDVHINKDKKATKVKANPKMISLVGETFEQMGFPLK